MIAMDVKGALFALPLLAFVITVVLYLVVTIVSIDRDRR